MTDLDCDDIDHRVIVAGVGLDHFDRDHDGIGFERYP
jgi:hypothetical protein